MAGDNVVSIIIEQAFSSSYWCSQYLRGINAEAKRKNVDTCILTDISEFDNTTHVNTAILIGTSLLWLYETIEQLRARSIKCVVLSAQKRQGFRAGVSFISMDYEDALEKLTLYLASIGRTRTALFAVNPDSTTDQNKKAAFLSANEQSTEKDVYYFNATLDELCRQLHDNIDSYDSVICVNHISEIVLSKYLDQHQCHIPHDIHIAVFGDSEVDRDERMQEHTLIRIKPKEAGKLAIRTVRLLEGHPELSRVSLSICCEIITKDGAVSVDDSSCTIASAQSEHHSSRSERISSALIHERILCNCDRVDIEILKGITERESYSKIASRIHISENTIGYRIKRLMALSDMKTKEEMIKALEPYLN